MPKPRYGGKRPTKSRRESVRKKAKITGKDIVLDKNNNIRFKDGTKACGLCGSKKKVIQFERHITRKGLPIIEMAFLCESCADKHDLINDSTLIT